MNENSHAVRRRLAAWAAVAVVLPALAACGADIDPPAQDISRNKAEKTDTVTVPDHTTGNRLDFGDEYGKAPAKDRRTDPPDERNLNRLDFRDNGL
ncbi:hypothetical protein [uncultured Nocardioides sp.]|uniref:hypothetical protein n=1 Tax=uncultured Nocardioides sp. TaxID=198441 RepID=UPI002608BD02|nr:hypothetical protein [uncultured Nocardioides sp.]